TLVLAVFISLPLIASHAREILAREIARMTAMEVRIGRLDLGLSPLRAEIDEVQIGGEHALLSLARAVIRVDSAASIAHLQLVARLEASGLHVEIPPSPRRSDPGSNVTPSARSKGE